MELYRPRETEPRKPLMNRGSCVCFHSLDLHWTKQLENDMYYLYRYYVKI